MFSCYVGVHMTRMTVVVYKVRESSMQVYTAHPIIIG